MSHPGFHVVPTTRNVQGPDRLVIAPLRWIEHTPKSCIAANWRSPVSKRGQPIAYRLFDRSLVDIFAHGPLLVVELRRRNTESRNLTTQHSMFEASA
ncbi:MAG: hypothetical protein WAO58_00570 [Fimbriimonadaceae bacterium]